MIWLPAVDDTDFLPIFFDETSINGTRQLVYQQTVQGEPWKVITALAAQEAQNLSLRIAGPILRMIAIVAFLAVIVLNLGLGVVTRSLESLTSEADDIARGRLDNPLTIEGEDEVGQLRRSFEKMRFSLKARLDELNQLLRVSRGVASTLELKESIQPVLEASLGTGACAARIVLSPSLMPELNGPWIASVVGPTAMRWILGLSFIAMAAWTMVPDKYEEEQARPPRFGVFGTTLVAFFLVEMGDKTQIATVALAAKYGSLVAVVGGTTLGMMLANVLAVLLGEAAARKLPMRVVHGIAAAIFLVLGLSVLLGLGSFG